MAKKRTEEALAPEWSYPVDVGDIEDKPFKVTANAEKEDRRALARRFGIIALKALSVEAVFFRESGSLLVHVKATLKAKVTQECVVTTDPVESDIEEEFEAWYADPDQAVSLAKARRDKQQENGQSELPILSEKDDPEPIIDGKIDLGELAAQYLSLSINPYPHAEGVQYEHGDDEDFADKPAQPRENPFAALKEWKAGQEDEKA